MYKCEGKKVIIVNKYPKIEKEIEDFLLDEEGSIPRNKVLMIGSMVLLLNIIMTQEVFAGHYSHSSHRSHSSHSSAHHGNHGNHASHNSIGSSQVDAPSFPQPTPEIPSVQMNDVATTGTISALGSTPEFGKEIK